MAEGTNFDEAAIRREAYYLWEADGKPHGRDHHYWTRAVEVLTERQKPPAPKKAAPKAKAKPEPVKLKAAASKVKDTPTKAAKPEAPKKPAKPKKK